MGFKDSDFLKWQDGMWEAEQSLIARQRTAGEDSDHPDYGVWSRYVGILRKITDHAYGGDIHASVNERQVAFLKATGVPV